MVIGLGPAPISVNNRPPPRILREREGARPGEGPENLSRGTRNSWEETHECPRRINYTCIVVKP